MGTRRPPEAPATNAAVAAVAVTRRIIRRGWRTALVPLEHAACFAGMRDDPPYATSQASGMLSVSRVRLKPTAMSASAGPVTRPSSARVEASATLT